MHSQSNPVSFPPKIASAYVKPLAVVFFVIWFAAVLFGFYSLTVYELRPGEKGKATVDFPSGSTIFRSPGKPTLIMFVHPHCPCTRASVGELAKIMCRAQGRVNATVMFLKPAGFSQDWTKSDLWSAVTAIPGVRAAMDIDGAEAKRFGCVTSGHTLLYDSYGHLAFSGGITSSRGHHGDNDGMESVVAFLLDGKGTTKDTNVYGCSLGNGPNPDEPMACLKIARPTP